jgi:CheY-specific phosphatase CheX
MDALKAVMTRYIFCLVYPNALLRGIAQITSEVLADEFPTWTLKQETPFIVHDRIIFGEVMSLIQLESLWCRGYMMLQTEEEALLKLMGSPATVDRRVHVADVLAEITNRIWGAFKNRFIGTSRSFDQAQVPLVVNHKQRYISFGTQNPQLCFRYTLSNQTHSCTLDERFIFNLNWTPEDFQEITQDSVDCVQCGELQLF